MEAVMKKLVLLTLACSWLLIVLAPGASSAQEVGLKITIPFDFNVAEQVLPAGDYLILAPGGQKLRILGPSRTSALALTNHVSGPRPSGPGPGFVVFNCYGERCFLARFWTARTDTGQEVLKSSTEKKLASQKEMVATITLRGKPY
jgi:hypothetical protein